MLVLLCKFVTAVSLASGLILGGLAQAHVPPTVNEIFHLPSKS
jgi:hypothetical protein